MQRLHLSPIQESARFSACGFQHLQSLTKLELKVYYITKRDSSSIGQLTNLSALQLSCTAFDAAALAPITGLQSLTLSGCVGPAAGLFHLLVQLTLLTQLALTEERRRSWGYPNPVVLVRGDMEDVFGILEDGFDAGEGRTEILYDYHDGQNYKAMSAAMLSSPHLQQLNLAGWFGIPNVTWQSVFTSVQDLHLSQLSSLVLPNGDDGWDWEDTAAADVDAIVRCCPALRTLQGGWRLPVQPPLGSLRQLTCLHAAQAGVPADAGTIADLTGLRELKLYWTDGLRGEDVAPLVRLKHLTSLCLFTGWRDWPVCDRATDLLHRLVSLSRLELCDQDEPSRDSLRLSMRQLQGLTNLTNLTHLSVGQLPGPPEETSLLKVKTFTNKVCVL